jgi:hypothetical protein
MATVSSVVSETRKARESLDLGYSN